MEHVDVVIIGGGAAGLMCAIAAGKRGRNVVVLEGSNKIGKKILMSGGGRCNFTNVHTDATYFISGNPHFCKSALSRYTQWDFIALVEKHNIPFHEKSLGQLFCNESSKDIVAMLSKECEEAGVRVMTDCDDIRIERNTQYTLRYAKGGFTSESLVVASGGLSIPKMGASDFGYRLARQFDLRLVTTSAGLVPMTMTGELHELCQRLSGVSCTATVATQTAHFTEELLFTHRGLSGPAILQASSYWQPGESIRIDLLPGLDLPQTLTDAKQRRPKVLLKSLLSQHLPKALVNELQSIFWPESVTVPLAGMSDERLRAIAGSLHSWCIKPASTEGYRTAEVTLGGIDTDELSSKTMESKKHAGLFFIGEVVDVTGHLGGFNFQWAWSSAHAAGRVA